MEKKNQVLMSVLGVFALVIVTVGVSYAFFSYTRTSENENTINAGEFEFGFVDTEQSVLLKEAYPVLQKTATAATATTDNVVVYDFNVYYKATGNTKTQYRISLVDTTADSDGTKFDLTTVKASLYSHTTEDGLDSEAGSTLVWNRTLKEALDTPTIVELDASGTTYYRMKMWLDADKLKIAAADTDGDGVIVDKENDNFTATGGQTVVADWANKVVKVKVKVEALSNADGDALYQ